MNEAFTGLDLGDELSWEPMRLVWPSPWTGHIAFAFWLIKTIRPATFVELGTHSGNSYFAFCQAMAAFTPAGRAYAVDTWKGDDHSGGYGEEVWTDAHAFNAQHFRGFSTLLRTTFDDARLYFADGSIDLLHIDGLHTYEAVRHDFESWLPALSPRAVVVFHDTNVRERGFGVWRFFDELRERYPAFLFDHSSGLGIAGIGAQQPAAMRALFALSDEPAAASSLRRRVAARGEAFQRLVELDAMRARAARAELALHHQGEEVGRLAAELAARDATVAAQRDAIRALEATVANLGHSATVQAQSLSARDAIAAQLTSEMRQQRMAADDERRQLAELEHRHAAVVARIEADRASMRQEADRALAGAEEMAARAQRRTAEDVARIYADSTSWRLTRPLRAASRLLRSKLSA